MQLPAAIDIELASAASAALNQIQLRVEVSKTVIPM